MPDWHQRFGTYVVGLRKEIQERGGYISSEDTIRYFHKRDGDTKDPIWWKRWQSGVWQEQSEMPRRRFIPAEMLPFALGSKDTRFDDPDFWEPPE